MPESLVSQVVVVRSEHPLVCQLVEQSLLANCEIHVDIVPFSRATSVVQDRLKILLLDTHSVRQWPEILLQWQSPSSKAIILVSLQLLDNRSQLQGLYLGAQGIVSMSANMATELPKAIKSVSIGRLWIGREILTEYVEKTNDILRRLSPQKAGFTPREEQVFKLLRRGSSNRQISNALGISERTTKFHVSNILNKSSISSRRDLIAMCGVAEPAVSGQFDPMMADIQTREAS